MNGIMQTGNLAFTLEDGTRGIISSDDHVTLVAHTDEEVKVINQGTRIKFIVTEGVTDLEVMADPDTIWTIETQTKYERSNPSDPIPYAEIMDKMSEDTDAKMRRFINEAISMRLTDIGDADIREEMENFDIDDDGILTFSGS